MPPDSGGRNAILDTSAKLFSQQGYKEVSIRDIAQACGMTNAALYYHFKNKEDLFLAMLERDHEQTLVALREAANGPGDLRADLKQLVACYAEVTCQRRQSFQTLRRDLSSVENVRGHKLFAEMHSELYAPAGRAADTGPGRRGAAARRCALLRAPAARHDHCVDLRG